MQSWESGKEKFCAGMFTVCIML